MAEHYQRPGSVHDKRPQHRAELGDDEKPLVLPAHLAKWEFEVGAFFGGVGPDAPDAALRRIAPDHPVSRLTITDGAHGRG